MQKLIKTIKKIVTVLAIIGTISFFLTYLN